MALTKIDDRGLKTPIDLLDNEKIRFGTGNDLEIFHDGSNSYIADTGTGRLLLKGSGIRLHNAAGNENYIHCDDNGAIELYYDNVKKFETIPAGCRVSSGNLYILDNSEINIGNGNDLKIYHDGTDSFIYGTTGTRQLKIRGQEIRVVNEANSEIQAKFIENGAVELYYDNSKKFETHSGGCIFTGNLYGLDNHQIQLGNSNDFKIYHNGTDSYLDNSTGNLQLTCNEFRVKSKTGGESHIQSSDEGEVQLYYDGSKKFWTNSWGCSISGALNLTGDIQGTQDNLKLLLGGGNDLQIFHDPSVGNVIQNAWQPLVIKSTNGKTQIKTAVSAQVELYYDGGKKLETTSTGAIFTSGAANTTSVRFGNTANRGLTISTYNNAGNNDSGVVLNAADSENSGYAATLEFDLGGVEFGRFDGNYDIFKLASACNGITFNGDYAAENRLNDYEEGTFTVAVSTHGNAPTISGTSSWTGNYTKIGNVVHVNGYINAVNVTNAGTGTTKITGLPFTCISSHTTVCITHNDLTAQTCDAGYIGAGTTYLTPIQSNSTSGSALNTGFKYLMFTTTYLTNA